MDYAELTIHQQRKLLLLFAVAARMAEYGQQEDQNLDLLRGLFQRTGRCVLALSVLGLDLSSDHVTRLIESVIIERGNRLNTHLIEAMTVARGIFWPTPCFGHVWDLSWLRRSITEMILSEEID
ncbi:hypothetical protein BVRB_037920, partial [Beta vulgaris subsp. vulgaris]